MYNAEYRYNPKTFGHSFLVAFNMLPVPKLNLICLTRAAPKLYIPARHAGATHVSQEYF